jgi:hypothetical protein
MNTSLANMLNESSISNMQISIQQVHLTLSEFESVDTDTYSVQIGGRHC